MMDRLLEKILHVDEQLRTLEWGFVDLSGKRIGTGEDHANYAIEYLRKHRKPGSRIPKQPDEVVAKFLKLTGSIRYFIEKDEVGFTVAAPVNSIQVSALRKMLYDVGDAVYFDIVDVKGDVLKSGKGFPNLISTLEKMDLLEKILRVDEARGYWRDWSELQCQNPDCRWRSYRKTIKKSQPEVLKTMKCPECGAELKLEESLEESSIDFPREDLDPAVWDKEDDSYVLKDEVKAHIIDVISKYPDKDLNDTAKEIRIVGSIGTNQYRDTADVDVHITPKNAEDWDEEKVKKVVRWFNENRDELDAYIEKHPIEVYIQVNPNQDLMSDSCYSLSEENWLVGPKIVSMSSDPYADFSHIVDDIRNTIEGADKLFGELKRDVIDFEVITAAMERMSGEDKKRLLHRLQSKLEELEIDIDALYTKKAEWVKARKEASSPETPEQALKDVELAKEWRDTNAVFKFIDRYHYFRTINDLKKLLDDEEITSDEISVIKNILGVSSD